MEFQQYYRGLFDTFGYPLAKNASVAASSLASAAKTLGVVVPPALSDYFAVAGNEKRFNQSHNRFLSIKHWHVKKKRLVFMVENQAVLFWGVSLGNPLNEDPPVSQAVNDDDDDDGVQWFQENRHCSAFIAVMLHFQAVFGGFSHCARAPVPRDLKRQLKVGWTCHGNVNRLTAYSRQNQVVCVEPEMGLLVGGKTKQDLIAIGKDLSLSLT